MSIWQKQERVGLDRPVPGQSIALSLSRFVKRYWYPYLLIAPTILLMVGILFYPLLYGLQISFTNKELLGRSVSFVGLKNYTDLLKDEVFWVAVQNTAVWTVYGVVGRIGFGLVLALLLNEALWGRGILRVLFLVPWAMPSVVVGIMFIWLYDPLFGYLNQYLRHLDLIQEPIYFLLQREFVLPAVAAPAIWKGYPFAMLALLAALQSVDVNLYEAAKVDGANRLQRFLYITVPSIRPVLMLLLLLETIWVFNNFDFVYILTRGGPGNATDLLSTYSYMSAFDAYRISYGATIAAVQFLILLGLSLVYFRIYGSREDQ